MSEKTQQRLLVLMNIYGMIAVAIGFILAGGIWQSLGIIMLFIELFALATISMIGYFKP